MHDSLRWDILSRLRAATLLFERLRKVEGGELHVQRQLRREFPVELVRAALELQALRRKAVVKFSRADRMWLDRVGLEQATAEPVARHKAQRFHGDILDLCCGLGGDTLGLAERGRVVAVDRNPAGCLLTAWNADVYGVQQRLTVACSPVEAVHCGRALVHIDPDRRPGGRRRSVRVEDCRPGIEFLKHLAESATGGAIKLSPAANFGGKFPEAEIELVSLGGECKEATVWFGALARPGLWRATVLPAGETLAGDPLGTVADATGLRRYLYDPDPSLVRAGLLDLACDRFGLTRLDDAEEYLTGDSLPESKFVQAFEVLAELPNNDREVRRYFRGQSIGQVEIKCRRIPTDVEGLRRRLPLNGREAATLVFARVGGKARAIVCRRVFDTRAGFGHDH